MAKATEKTASESTEIAEVVAKPTGLATVAEFMDLADFGADASGFEGIDKDSFAIPFLMVLQKTSPLVDENHAKFVDGAKPGMFYNTVTGALYDGKVGVKLIPSYFKRSFVEWGGRESATGGGFKGEFTPEQIEAMKESGEIVVIEGQFYRPDEDGNVKEPKKANYFADTRSHYVVATGTPVGKTEEESGVAVLALSGTLSKASRTLMTMLDQKRIDTPQGKKRPPTFANNVKMTTVGMSNAKGSWSGVKFELDGLVTDAGLYLDAKQFHLNITGGKVKADFAKADAGAHADDAEASDEPTTADKF